VLVVHGDSVCSTIATPARAGGDLFGLGFAYDHTRASGATNTSNHACAGCSLRETRRELASETITRLSERTQHPEERLMPIEPTREQIEELAASPSEQPVVMLNLLRFKDRAEGIDQGVSGLEAYERYAEAVAPFLRGVGGRVLLSVRAHETVIGPQAREWDMVLMVEYPSRSKFLEMATDPDYLKVHQHRAAGLADSRLVACETLSP